MARTENRFAIYVWAIHTIAVTTGCRCRRWISPENEEISLLTCISRTCV